MMPEKVKQITQMKLSPDKKQLLVAEQQKHNRNAYISVYETQDKLNTACYFSNKVYNITELSEGRGNLFVNGQSVNQHSNNNSTVSPLGGTGTLAAT